jgi:1-acyl-sn-glycerol-3-phosphate acyltransferase
VAARARRTGAWARHPPLLVFPEATCSTGAALLRFKSGAFVAGVPVLPLAIRYDAGRLNAGWVWREEATRVRGFRAVPGDLLHLARLLAARGKRLDIFVLPVHAPSAAERADPALFAESVRREVGAALRVPLDSRGVEDARAYYSMRIKGYAKSA